MIETGIGTERNAAMIVQNEVTEDRVDLEDVVGGGEAEEAIGLVVAGIRPVEGSWKVHFHWQYLDTHPRRNSACELFSDHYYRW